MTRRNSDADGNVRVRPCAPSPTWPTRSSSKHKLDAGRGDAKLAKRLAALPDRDDPRVQLEIVIALGRLRWAGAADWLRDNLVKPDATLAHAAMQTLRRSENWPAVLKLLDQPEDTPIRKIVLHAIVDQHETDGRRRPDRHGWSEKTAERQREYAEALARVYKKPARGSTGAIAPGRGRRTPESWERTAGDRSGAQLLARQYRQHEPNGHAQSHAA